MKQLLWGLAVGVPGFQAGPFCYPLGMGTGTAGGAMGAGVCAMGTGGTGVCWGCFGCWGVLGKLGGLGGGGANQGNGNECLPISPALSRECPILVFVCLASHSTTLQVMSKGEEHYTGY